MDVFLQQLINGITLGSIYGLIAIGYPAEDLAGYTEGTPLPIGLRELARSGMPFRVRDYQRDVAALLELGTPIPGLY